MKFKALFLCALAIIAPVSFGQSFITVASTTSTEQSGLFGVILPSFEKETGIQVKVIAVGTGQALDIGAPWRCRCSFSP
jgi:tungstate transport system substrate-binding protein